jgi:hypothetical protein
MLDRRTFLAGCAAFGAFSPTASPAADGALGHLDHSSWVVRDSAAGISAFRKLGFTLTPKPKVQADGALSTFALFPDFTYLEIVETHLAEDGTLSRKRCEPRRVGRTRRKLFGDGYGPCSTRHTHVRR